MPAIRLHPENPKVFEFRGKPRVLVTATEHYGAVLNRRFRYERYLADAAEKGMTVTRLFVLFRELQSQMNPYSTCKPESPDYVAPFVRTGPGRARDGQARYDLDRWNPEFFERLHGFLGLASAYGIVVEVTLLSNTYMPEIWALQALNPANNLAGWPEIPWYDYMSRRHAPLWERQQAHVRRMVQETNRYDNIFYEICNEPGANATPGGPTLAETNAWLAALGEVIRETEVGLPNRHLIVGQEAFAYTLPDETGRTGPDVHQFADETLDGRVFAVANMHPLSNMVLGGRHYDLGQFMCGQKRLRNLQRYCEDIYQTYPGKPLNLDEDNAAAQYKDARGWTIHRQRAWTTVLCGGHYDVIDFSIWPGLETGTEESQKQLRAWFGHLAKFVHTLDLVRARPMRQVVRGAPEKTVVSVLAVADEDYAIYVADERETDEAGAGEVVRGELIVDLPAGDFTVACFSPVSGLYSPAVRIAGGAGTRLGLPEFRADVVVRIGRVGGR